MYDVVISIAGIYKHDNTEYVATRVFRVDLEDGPDEIEKFMGYLEDYEGVAHVESLSAV